MWSAKSRGGQRKQLSQQFSLNLDETEYIFSWEHLLASLDRSSTESSIPGDFISESNSCLGFLLEFVMSFLRSVRFECSGSLIFHFPSPSFPVSDHWVFKSSLLFTNLRWWLRTQKLQSMCLNEGSFSNMQISEICRILSMENLVFSTQNTGFWASVGPFYGFLGYWMMPFRSMFLSESGALWRNEAWWVAVYA